MKPEAITPAVEFLLSEDAPTRTIMGAGAGSFAVIKMLETEGINLPQSEWTPDAVAAHFAEISDMSKAKALQGAFEQTQKVCRPGRGEGRGSSSSAAADMSVMVRARFAHRASAIHARKSGVDAGHLARRRARSPGMTIVLAAPIRLTLAPCRHLPITSPSSAPARRADGGRSAGAEAAPTSPSTTRCRRRAANS